VLCAYWPLRIEAREGQHREVVAKALEKLAPSLTHAEWSVVREKTDLSRSSARMRITLGLPFEWGVPASVFWRPLSRTTWGLDFAVSAVCAEPAPSALKQAAACVPIPKNRQARTSTARSRR
jgi:hypothetical protein